MGLSQVLGPLPTWLLPVNVSDLFVCFVSCPSDWAIHGIDSCLPFPLAQRERYCRAGELVDTFSVPSPMSCASHLAPSSPTVVVD